MLRSAKFFTHAAIFSTLFMLTVWLNAAQSYAQSSRDSASGHGTLIVQDESGNSVRRQFSFNAQRQKNGMVNGQAVLHNPAFPGDTGNKYKANMEIKCINVIGNVAILSGTVRRTNDPINELAYFAVQDNGEPGSSDRITNVFFFYNGTTQDPSQVCRELTVEDFTNSEAGDLFQTIESGNIQVRGGSTVNSRK